MTHNESSWPKSIYQRGDTLAGLAHIKERRDQATKRCCPTTDPAPIIYITFALGWGWTLLSAWAAVGGL